MDVSKFLNVVPNFLKVHFLQISLNKYINFYGNACRPNYFLKISRKIWKNKDKYIHIYNFKTVGTKNFIKNNLYKKIILNWQWKIVRNFPHSETNFFTMKKFKTGCDYGFKENCKTTSVIVIFMIFLKPQLLTIVLLLLWQKIFFYGYYDK